MYLWIVIVGGIFSFFAAAGIGANDTANAFSTSIGSKSLTLKQAVILASIFETSGALLMGSRVSETIRKGIADYECFTDDSYALMYGCMWVVFSVGLWLFLASYFEMPVSTTHSCVGGMIGMTWALKGKDCVIWYKQVDTFPWVGGVSGIILSWFISPLFSAIISMILFSTIREFILRKNFNKKRIYYLYPVLIGNTISLNCFFIIYKGAKGIGLDDINAEYAILISIGSGIISGIGILPFLPKISNYIEQKFSINNDNNDNNANENNTENKINCSVNKINPINISIDFNSKNEKNKVENIHSSAEKFDSRTEEYFKYLQIFTAMCDAFSHGANDVANAIGPFAAILTIYKYDIVTKKSAMDDDGWWILGLGGIGITLGLILYGYKIINAIGIKLCKITPSRGAIIELSSATVIIIGSRLKIPLSTTHCQIGSTIGVGLLEDYKNITGINKNILIKTIFGWVITCFIVGLTTAILTLQGIHAPKLFENNTHLLL